MTTDKIKKINETMLLSLHDDCLKNINQACICYSLHINTAKAIANLDAQTLLSVSSAATVVIYPSLIPLEIWERLETLKEDAIAAITIAQNAINC